MTAAPAEHHVTIGGAVHGWCEAGQGGVPLLLLHGIGSNAASWAAQLAGFGATRRVLAWNLPGYGSSTPLPLPAPGPDDYVESLQAFLAARGVDRCDVVGHSLGGLLAGRLAVRAPGLLRRLVLSSPAAGYRVAAGEAALPETLRARLADLESLGPAGLAARRAAGTVAPDTAPEILARVTAAMAAITPAGYRAAVWMLARGDLAADGAALRLPVLVIVGAADRVTPPAKVAALAAQIPGAVFQIIPRAGHASYADHEKEYGRIVSAFLDE
mgnify:CR=1 FL=1